MEKEPPDLQINTPDKIVEFTFKTPESSLQNLRRLAQFKV